MNPTAWIDVTRPIYPGMPVWPGDPDVAEQPLSRIEMGDACNVTLWTLGSHTGTHVDPPLHFIEGGATVPEMEINTLCGPCRVLDLTHLNRHVTADDLAGAGDCARIVLKTRNSFTDPAVFHEDFLAVDHSAAEWLISTGVRLIGIDGPSIERFNAGAHPVHHAILGAGIAVIEGLALADIRAGDYELICAPLPWRNGDGAPCRALLRAI